MASGDSTDRDEVDLVIREAEPFPFDIGEALYLLDAASGNDYSVDIPFAFLYVDANHQTLAWPGQNLAHQEVERAALYEVPNALLSQQLPASLYLGSIRQLTSVYLSFDDGATFEGDLRNDQNFADYFALSYTSLSRISFGRYDVKGYLEGQILEYTFTIEYSDGYWPVNARLLSHIDLAPELTLMFPRGSVWFDSCVDWVVRHHAYRDWLSSRLSIPTLAKTLIRLTSPPGQSGTHERIST